MVKFLQIPLRTVRRLPLRWVLVVPFVFQLSATVGLTGYLSLQNGQRAVNELVTKLNQEVSDRVLQHLDTFALSSRRTATMVQREIEVGRIRPTDSRSMLSFLWQQAENQDVGYLLYGDNSGMLLGAGFDSNNNYRTITEINPRKYKNLDLYAYATDAQGYPKTQTEHVKDYKFQVEDWFAKTLKIGLPNWSSIYNWQAQPYPLAVAASIPLKNQQGEVVASIAAESRLSQISHFLRKLSFSRSGRVFILERSGDLVANSDASDPFTIENNLPKRMKGKESPDPLIRAAAQYLQNESLNTIETSKQKSFDHAGEKQYLRIVPWKDEWGLDWLVVVVVPESTFMAQIHENTQNTVLLCLMALAIATLLGLYTSRWIAQPILQLREASYSLAQGDFDHQSAESFVAELNDLGLSFNQMAKKLEQSFIELEDANDQLEERIEQRTEALRSTLAELHQTQAQMIQSEKMSALGQMVAGIAHEINNPVSFIQGNVQPAKHYAEDLLWLLSLYQQAYPQPSAEIQTAIESVDLDFIREDLSKLLQSMRVGADRISAIVLSLRSFSRLDESAVKTIDLHEGIESTLMLFQHRFRATVDRPGIEIVRNYGELPKVECYAGQINQVFMNLLANAIDALEQSNRGKTFHEISNCITISTRTIPNDQVQVIIEDNGIGMCETVKQQIFNPFYTTKPVGKGTGLGLAVSYQIVTETHHGRLICHSTVGEGTQFIVQIPEKVSANPKVS
ncbi:integral membrane sensor signal transduction histidine kinase [Leptolyngbya sp. NIES-3755]|nr:integral membrane sensor signal transduction histidine kinase [Leptolyngbya sp. NIES-3755]